MPCGGIYPMNASAPPPADCWQCGGEHPDCELVEWDSYLHSHCVDDFLATDEGKLVLEHGHSVSVWFDGEIRMLYPERAPVPDPEPTLIVASDVEPSLEFDDVTEPMDSWRHSRGR